MSRGRNLHYEFEVQEHTGSNPVLTTKNGIMKGIVKEDIVNTILEGYSINGICVHPNSENIAKKNVGKEVEYELNYDGYRKYGMWNEKFYEKVVIKI